MTTVIVTHAVNDSEHWLASTNREEFFGPLGITTQTFLHPENPTLAAVVADVPDMDAFQAAMQSDAAAAAMAADGVQADTVQFYVQT